MRGGHVLSSDSWQTTVYEDAALPASATEEYACDIVVGTGIAGMSAAVEAAESGASVIVLAPSRLSPQTATPRNNPQRFRR